MKIKDINTRFDCITPIFKVNPDNSTHGIEIANMDTSISPGENFYEYACGGWNKAHPIPADHSRYGTFDELRENAKQQLQELILNLKENPDINTPGTIAQKISDLFDLGMDAERLNREGALPMRPYLEKIENTDPDNPVEFAELLAWMTLGIGIPFFGGGVGADPKDSDINMYHLSEAGLQLGDRDYYLEKTPENEKILKAYEEFVKKLVTYSGYSQEDADRIWNTQIRVETEFAKHKKTREERRDPRLSCNIVSFEELKERYPFIDWDTYFKSVELAEIDRVNITSIRFYDFLNTFLPGLSSQQKRDLMIWEFISSSSGLLSDKFELASFELFSKTMSGVEEQEPRWKRSMGLVNSMFGEAIGELYVEKYFPKENKTYMLQLVENLRTALSEHITDLTWMSEETKTKALAKLKSMRVKIGYPEKWKDYSELKIDPTLSYLDNVLNASRWFVKDGYSKWGKPVDKEEWFMYPQTLNAYYAPTLNEICFPAGILQPPYFDIHADDAINYGGIGVVIGHEMTHGFDDSGRNYDEKGNLNDWWTAEDSEAFTNLADKLVEQFNSVEVAPGVYANGKFTLGENIADQGGLRIALTAFLNSNPKQRVDDSDGFLPLQRFYLGYAQVWAGNIRDEAVLVRTKSDPHSLDVNRVNVTLRNITPFFEAFNIKEGDKMYLPEADRVIIW